MNRDELHAIAQELASSWSLPELAVTARIEYSTRMTTALGRCIPGRRTVRLNARLRDTAPDLIREVLCHELAHLAVHLRFGAAARPHGPEWCALVEGAGYIPRRRAPRVLDGGRISAPARTVSRFEHRCPVCQAVRIARTSTLRWRCAECVADGLDGGLIVSRVAPPASER